MGTRHLRRWSVPFVATIGLVTTAVPAGASTGLAYPGDFPDPFVLNAGEAYFAFSTQVAGDSGGWINVPVLRSSNGLSGWAPPPSGPDALPDLPAWARSGNTWGPSVVRTGAARFVLYYTVTNDESGLQCISRATSSVPQGPYTDQSSGPLVCQSSLGGSIDPNPFRAPDGTLYLLWKSDNNRLGNPTTLWARRLTPDGRSFGSSRAHALLSADSGWENGIIEGPAMTAVAATGASPEYGSAPGHRYYLLYGAGDWASSSAGIGYAICSGPLGSCTKMTTTAPWLATGSGATGAIGPASPSFYVLGSSSPYSATQKLAYHGWFCRPGTTCSPPTGYAGGAVRAMWINTVGFSTSPLLVASP